jgi:hypothetical protein
VPNQNDIVQITVGDFAHDVLDVGLLTGKHALLIGETGQRQRVGAMPSRAQLWDDLVPCRGSEPRAGDEYEFGHGRQRSAASSWHSGRAAPTG